MGSILSAEMAKVPEVPPVAAKSGVPYFCRYTEVVTCIWGLKGGSFTHLQEGRIP